MKRLIAYLLAASIGSYVPAAGAQEKNQQDKGEIRLRTELVQIDVIVTDKSNKPVSGLTREDFQLLDNDKPQHISNFAYEETKARRVDDAAGENRNLPKAITAADV